MTVGASENSGPEVPAPQNDTNDRDRDTTEKLYFAQPPFPTSPTSKGQRKAHQAVTPHSFSCTYPFATVYVQDVYPPLS